MLKTIAFAVLIAFGAGSMAYSQIPSAAALDDAVKDLQLAGSLEVQDALNRIVRLSERSPVSTKHIQTIAGLLKSENNSVAYLAATTLQHIAMRHPKSFPQRSIATITAELNAKDCRFHCELLRVLWEIGPAARSALPEIRRFLDSDSPFENVHAAIAIGRISSDAAEIEKAVEILGGCLDSNDENRRALAAFGLGTLGRHATSKLDELRRRMRDDFRTVRVLAAIAAWNIDENTVDEVTRVLAASLEEEPHSVYYMPPYASEWVISHQSVAMVSLKRIGQRHPDRALPILRKALTSESLETRVFAVKALAGIEGTASDDLLQLALANESQAVRMEASRALEQRRNRF